MIRTRKKNSDHYLQLLLTRTHNQYIVIGAADIGLRPWEVDCAKELAAMVARGRSLCGQRNPTYISLQEHSWSTRFDKNEFNPEVYVAIFAEYNGRYAPCETDEFYCEVMEEPSHIWAIVVERYCHYPDPDSGKLEYAERAHYLHYRGRLSESATFDGVNLMDGALDELNDVLNDSAESHEGEWDEGQKWGTWAVVSKKRTPGIARVFLHRAVDAMRPLFGQGKDFFKLPKERSPRYRRMPCVDYLR